MCLDMQFNPSISRAKVPNRKAVMECWKVFQKTYDDKLLGSMIVGVHYPVDKWLTAKLAWNENTNKMDKKYLYLYGYGRYPVGFHCFRTHKDAVDYKGDRRYLIVRKVLVKNIVAHGLQFGMEVVVAKNMKVLPEEKK